MSAPAGIGRISSSLCAVLRPMLIVFGCLLAAKAAAQAPSGSESEGAGSAGGQGNAVVTAPEGTATLPETQVFGAAPVLGSGIDRNLIPGETQVLNSRDISIDATPNYLRQLGDQVPGVSFSNAASNPFQPDIFYHGFEASPLMGTPVGLAVYVNGVRFNQPFGDNVNWDLLPSIAIDRMELQNTNPVFGLNALGGALAVQLKNGFDFQGGNVYAYGGSFDTSVGEFEYGKQSGNVAAYIAGAHTDTAGWRDDQKSWLQQLYGDIGWRGSRGELHLSLIGAESRLDQPGTVPVQLLDVDRAALFTGPNYFSNRYGMAVLSANYDISSSTSLQGNAYVENLIQHVSNGNVPDAAPCSPPNGFLCVSGTSTFLTNMSFQPIPAFLGAGPYSQLNLQTLNTDGYGAAVQLTNKSEIFNRSNQFLIGASWDGGFSHFSADTLIGGLDIANRYFVGPGIGIYQADHSIAPVNLNDHDNYYGLYFLDIYQLTKRLAFNLSGRWNIASVDMMDHLGTALNSQNYYTHFNPAVGLTYQLTPKVTTYASYAVSNRIPTPAELSCASPTAPCTLTNFFVGDPPLKQIVADTVQAGVRGQFVPYDGAKLAWDVSAYRTQVTDDILMAFSPVQGSAFFQNIPGDLRQGVDLNFRLTSGRLTAWFGYSYTDAHFQNSFFISSPNNPLANADGNILVTPGKRMPSIPWDLVKLGAEYNVTQKWVIGTEMVGASGQYLVGDEANLTPPLGPYFIVGLNTSYQVTSYLQLFAQLENAFNVNYATFGTFSPTSLVPIVQVPGASNPRSLSPAAPIAVYGGVRASF